MTEREVSECVSVRKREGVQIKSGRSPFFTRILHILTYFLGMYWLDRIKFKVVGIMGLLGLRKFVVASKSVG